MLEIQGLIKVYPGGIAALQGINLQIDRGMFGLLGPNGAGKSTFMKILTGLLEPTSGKILFEGHDIVTHPEKVWGSLGYLPQDFGFYPHLTGEAMLTYLLKLKGVESAGGLKQLAGELLQRVNLSYAAKRKVKDYSGGMRQRLGIAQALAGNPSLVIVDEPTSGLDPEERHRFYHLLSELGQDRTVILSTHIVEDVAVLCPKFAVIRQGRVVAQTSPSEAIARLNGFLYEGIVEPAAMAELSRSHLVTQSVLFEGRHRARIHAQNGNVPPGFQPATPTLEDAYFVLIRSKEAAGAAA